MPQSPWRVVLTVMLTGLHCCFIQGFVQFKNRTIDTKEVLTMTLPCCSQDIVYSIYNHCPVRFKVTVTALDLPESASITVFDAQEIVEDVVRGGLPLGRWPTPDVFYYIASTITVVLKLPHKRQSEQFSGAKFEIEASVSSCSLNQQKCPDGSCISKRNTCPVKCPLAEKKCLNGECVSWNVDCGEPCLSHHTKCPNGQCVGPHMGCIGEPGQCFQHEQRCSKMVHRTEFVTCIIAHAEFCDGSCPNVRPHQCGSLCYGLVERCNGHKYCEDGTDENDCDPGIANINFRWIIVTIVLVAVCVTGLCVILFVVYSRRRRRLSTGTGGRPRYSVTQAAVHAGVGENLDPASAQLMYNVRSGAVTYDPACSAAFHPSAFPPSYTEAMSPDTHIALNCNDAEASPPPYSTLDEKAPPLNVV